MKRDLTLVLAWLALLMLLTLSAASVHVHALGRGLLAVSLVIAALKAMIVGSVFMGLRESRPLLRAVATCSLLALLVMGTLSQVDVLVRQNEPAPWQPPQHVEPASRLPKGGTKVPPDHRVALMQTDHPTILDVSGSTDGLVTAVPAVEQATEATSRLGSLRPGKDAIATDSGRDMIAQIDRDTARVGPMAADAVSATVRHAIPKP